jgi:predicted nucleic acid-binding protein
VSGVYVDTSALGRVLLGEPDADAVVASLRSFDVQTSSRLLRIELRRLASRHDVLDNADQLLTGVSLVPVSEELLQAAETVPPPSVATLDSIHLATALRLAAAGIIGALISYDSQLLEGARHHGLEAMSPA